MSNERVDETCSCGATFHYEGPVARVDAGRWRREHRHDMPQAAQDAACGSNRRSVGQEDVREAEGGSEEFLASLLKRQERDGFQRDEEKS